MRKIIFKGTKMKLIKRELHKHMNCLPWFIMGIYIMVNGNITRLQFFFAWISLLFFLWNYRPFWILEEEGKKMSNIQMDIAILKEYSMYHAADGNIELCGALDNAIKALKKQIPKEMVDDGAFGKCPCCGKEFNSELINEYEIRGCPWCLQALDMGQAYGGSRT